MDIESYIAAQIQQIKSELAQKLIEIDDKYTSNGLVSSGKHLRERGLAEIMANAKIDAIKAKLENNEDESKLKSFPQISKVTPNMYDPTSACFKFANISVPLPSQRNEDYLCRVIFRNDKSLKKQWLWDDILKATKDLLVSRSKNPHTEPWRPVYNAARKINDRLEKIGIGDLFLCKPITTIQVNPKYL